MDHQIWGDLRLDIELPDRKRVRGRAERLSVYESDAGPYCLTLFYEPSPDTSPPVDYWVEGGSPMERHAIGAVRVDRGIYHAQVATGKEQPSVRLHLEFPAHRTPSVSPAWLCH